MRRRRAVRATRRFLGFGAAALLLAGCTGHLQTVRLMDTTSKTIEKVRRAGADSKARELFQMAQQLQRRARSTYEETCRGDEARRLSLEARDKAMMAQAEAMKPPPPPPAPKPAPKPAPPPPPANRPPRADISGPGLGQVGKAMSFDGGRSTDPDGDALTYVWDFGDNSRSLAAKPSKSYLAPGSYTVALLVEDGKGGADRATHSVNIAPRPRRRIVLRNVNFDFDKADLRPDAIPILNEVVEYVKEYLDLTVIIEGHTDWTGSEQYNQGLSERRADSVRRHFISQGIAPRRLSTKGYGELQPVATNRTREGRSLNRRVEFKLLEP